ncbi:TPR-like protein [Rhizoctonia solani]|uniref:TPR-like protein n=1 Tax=Rhizoctonia solani TaxID=456999 RepID=A0A8H7ILK5_9AGAM|nr:TPR-like protein [Rhizoctonia solani]
MREQKPQEHIPEDTSSNDKERETTSKNTEQATSNQADDMSYDDVAEQALFHWTVKCHDARYLRLKDLDDLEKSIAWCIRRMEVTPKNDVSLLSQLKDMVLLYKARYQRLRRAHDLEKMLEYSSRLLAYTPEGHPSLPEVHDRAGEYRSFALELTPDGDECLPYRCAAVAEAYLHLYRRIGNMADLKKGIEDYTHALELTPDDNPVMAHWLASLGEHTAINMNGWKTWMPSPGLGDCHEILSRLYHHRFRRLGDATDLSISMEHISRALKFTPDGSQQLSDRFSFLGGLYLELYQARGDHQDLDRSIKLMTHAISFAPEDHHPARAFLYFSLGTPHSDRTVEQETWLTWRKRSSTTIMQRSSLPKATPSCQSGMLLYQCTCGPLPADGRPVDLGRAISFIMSVLDLTPDNHPSFPEQCTSLGQLYIEQFRRFGHISDIDKAIEYRSRALKLTPSDNKRLNVMLSNLGLCYIYRCESSGDITDVEKAIEHNSRALELTRWSHRPTRDIADLEKAIEYTSHALTLTPDGHIELPFRHYLMAASRHQQYQHTGDPSHLEVCLVSFRRSSKLSVAPPRIVFNNALDWARLASRHTYLHPIEAFRAAMELLPHFTWLGATASQRYYDVTMMDNLAVRAAAVAIRSSEYATGLEWLEHGRCLVWNQALTLRSPQAILEKSHPELAAQLYDVSQQLHCNENPKYRYDLAKKYSDLLTQARLLPGFEDFLQPTKAAGLLKAARHGPVVVVNCFRNDCDALVIMPGQDDIGHVALPNYTEAKARHARSEIEQLVTRSGRGTGVSDLWNDVIKPVLEHLGYLTNDVTGQLPHITWCPTGALTFLPLHAAGDYDQPRSKVFDYVVSSYTPTLTALLTSAPTMPHRVPRVLAIGQTATSGYSQLPGTTRELASIRTHTRDRAEYSQLTGRKATPKAVLKAMENHDWVHLACHAHQNEQGTGVPVGLPDGDWGREAAGRSGPSCVWDADGGYPSVIATMWSVMDEDAPMVADMVYSELMKDGR